MDPKAGPGPPLKIENIQCGKCKNWSTAYHNNCNECLTFIRQRKIALEKDLRINRATDKYEYTNGSVKYVIDPRMAELVFLKS